MGSGRGGPRSRRQKRRAMVLVLLAIALVTGGAIAGRHWLQGPRMNPKRLDLLQAALVEFQAKRYEQATAILDRRAAETTPIVAGLDAPCAGGRGPGPARGGPESSEAYPRLGSDRLPGLAQDRSARACAAPRSGGRCRVPALAGAQSRPDPGLSRTGLPLCRPAPEGGVRCPVPSPGSADPHGPHLGLRLVSEYLRTLGRARSPRRP